MSNTVPACTPSCLPVCWCLSRARARAQLLRASALFDDGQSLRGDGKLLILVLIVLAQCTPHASQDLRLLSDSHIRVSLAHFAALVRAKDEKGRTLLELPLRTVTTSSTCTATTVEHHRLVDWSIFLLSSYRGATAGRGIKSGRFRDLFRRFHRLSLCFCALLAHRLGLAVSACESRLLCVVVDMRFGRFAAPRRGLRRADGKVHDFRHSSTRGASVVDTFTTPVLQRPQLPALAAASTALVIIQDRARRDF
mmetsp:Transcript_54726/g.80268  ORF Transcript_54726/g.80268 Transcript_54726/m.80268 type:complete len:252 (+) Transcript_54726:539-1294(+)